MDHSRSHCDLPSARWVETALCDTRLWQSEVLDELADIGHAFTPRGFNMSSHSGPDTQNAPRRWRQICTVLGMPYGQLVAGRQVHGVKIARVTSQGADGSGARILESTDGLYTTKRNVPLMALSADCPLVILCDTKRHICGLVHSGWRGTLAGIVGKIVGELQADCGTNPRDLLAVISPSARVCCYEIRDDVRRLVIDATGDDRHIRTAGGAMYLDLGALIADQLLATGLGRDAIHLPDQCTICNESFYSYRRQGPGTGHAALVVCLR